MKKNILKSLLSHGASLKVMLGLGTLAAGALAPVTDAYAASPLNPQAHEQARQFSAELQKALSNGASIQDALGMINVSSYSLEAIASALNMSIISVDDMRIAVQEISTLTGEPTQTIITKVVDDAAITYGKDMAEELESSLTKNAHEAPIPPVYKSNEAPSVPSVPNPSVVSSYEDPGKLAQTEPAAGGDDDGGDTGGDVYNG